MEILTNIFYRISENTGVLLAIIGFFISIPLIIFVWNFFVHNGKFRRGLEFKWTGGGSSANPPRKFWISGHTWTTLQELKKVSEKNKKTDLPVKMNNFSCFDDYVQESRMPKFIRNKQEEQEMYYDATNLARGVLVVGSAGSGKTEWINTIVNQKFYKKAVIYSKKGDFEKYFYRPSIDILVNPKLEEGVIHDVLSEDIQYIMEYLNTLMNASIGKSQDYFSGSAKQKLQNFVQRIKISEKDNKLSVIEKWDMFIKFYENAMEQAAEAEQKSEKDIMSTVRATMELLYLNAYRIQNGARTFTVKDFFENKDEPTKLFLNSTDPSMDGMLSASAAVLIKYQLAMPDIKLYDPHFLVAYFLDEYLSFAKVIDDELLAEISRVGRSKGIQPFKMVQSFPTKQEERKELTSNVQYIIVFATTENETTLKVMNELIGKVEFEYIKTTETRSNNGESYNHSVDKENVDLVSSYMFNILQKENFSHIFFAPKEGLLYKGYQPPIELPVRDYIDVTQEIDLAEFYRWKIEKEDALKAKKDAIQNVAKIAK